MAPDQRLDFLSQMLKGISACLKWRLLKHTSDNQRHITSNLWLCDKFMATCCQCGDPAWYSVMPCHVERNGIWLPLRSMVLGEGIYLLMDFLWLWQTGNELPVGSSHCFRLCHSFFFITHKRCTNGNLYITHPLTHTHRYIEREGYLP